MTEPEHDDRDFESLEPPRPPEGARATGRYRIKRLPPPVQKPQAAVGTQLEPLADMIFANAARSDDIEMERRHDMASLWRFVDELRTFVEDRLAEQDAKLDSTADLLAATASVQRDQLAVIKTLKASIESLAKQVGQVRRCMRKVEGKVDKLQSNVDARTREFDELRAVVAVLEARITEFSERLHNCEEELEIREELEAIEDDPAEPAETLPPENDPGGTGSDAPAADDGPDTPRTSD